MCEYSQIDVTRFVLREKVGSLIIYYFYQALLVQPLDIFHNYVDRFLCEYIGKRSKYGLLIKINIVRRVLFHTPHHCLLQHRSVLREKSIM